MEYARLNEPVLEAYENMLKKGTVKAGQPAVVKGGKGKSNKTVKAPKKAKNAVMGKPKMPVAKKMVALKEEKDEMGESLTLMDILAQQDIGDLEIPASVTRMIQKLNDVLVDQEILEDVVNVLIARLDEPDEELEDAEMNLDLDAEKLEDDAEEIEKDAEELEDEEDEEKE